jgi:hypothetical protein
VHGLSFFTGVDPQLAERVESESRRLARRFTSEQWDKRIESNSRHIQIALFNGIIRDAKRWLFEQPAGTGAGGDAVGEVATEADAQTLNSEEGPEAGLSEDEKTIN